MTKEKAELKQNLEHLAEQKGQPAGSFLSRLVYTTIYAKVY